MSDCGAPALRVLQRWFVGITTRPEFIPGRPATRMALRARETIERWVTAGPTESALDRLAIYRDGYFARLTECLGDDYPALKACMGEAKFDELCGQYIDAHPSRRPNLNRFGQRLPDFLASHDHASRSFLRELAQLEWALVECVHARAEDGRLLEDLQTLAPDQLARVRFVPNSSLRLFEFEYPTNQILQTYFAGRDVWIPSPESTRLAVVRQATQVWRVDLDLDSFGLLARLRESQPLGEALRGTTATPEGLRASFATWVQCGLFVGAEL